MDQRLDGRGGAGPAPDGSLFLNVGAKPSRPVDGARRRAGGPRAPAAAEHHSLDQVDRHRPRVGRRRRRADARPGGRPLQADQQRPVPERLPRVHFSLHAAGRDRARSAGARRAVSGPVEHRAAGAARPTACAAAATPGSSPTKRSSGAIATGRIPATFPSRLPEQCLRLHGLNADSSRDGSVHRPRQHGGRVRAAGRQLRRRRHRRGLSDEAVGGRRQPRGRANADVAARKADAARTRR